MAKLKIGMLTGGGDAPGLNSVIYAFTRACLNKHPDWEVIGYRFGYRGLYENNYILLDREAISGIQHRGGTILYSSNKDNLFDYQVEENGKMIKKDVSDVAIANLKENDVDVLMVLGGDGTLTSARDFSNKGVKVIGIPKTIDNDLGATDTTFGFDTAVNIVTENLGRLHTTAESHHRVMIVEVMGRDSGWIALYSGVAGSADVILIPEFPYSLEKIADIIKERNAKGRPFTIIVVTEGAKSIGGETVIGQIVADSPDPVRFGGIANKLAHDLSAMVSNEIRSCQLGHIQRGGEPSPADRVLSARYGRHALQMIENGEFGKMARLVDNEMGSIDLNEVIGHNKYVTQDTELVKIARDMGISFADM